MAHKKHKRTYLNILLIPDDESSTRSLKVRYSFLTGGLVLLVVILVGFLIGVFTYGQLVQKAYENIRLRQENEQMQKQLQKIGELTDELKNLKAYGRKVRNSLMGYVKIADDVEGLSSAAGSETTGEETIFSIFTSVPIKAPVVGFISQEFTENIHNGIDIVAPEGTPVVAAGSGRVLYSGWTIDGGYTIIIGHSHGFYSYYKHNLRNLVQTNQAVEQGEVIAYLGNSGQKSFGPHLHFEVWRNGRPIDPRKLVQEFNNKDVN